MLVDVNVFHVTIRNSLVPWTLPNTVGFWHFKPGGKFADPREQYDVQKKGGRVLQYLKSSGRHFEVPSPNPSQY